MNISVPRQSEVRHFVVRDRNQENVGATISIATVARTTYGSLDPCMKRHVRKTRRHQEKQEGIAIHHSTMIHMPLAEANIMIRRVSM